jgi:DNA-binding LacI/PurR family transcriptional regulator
VVQPLLAHSDPPTARRGAGCIGAREAILDHKLSVPSSFLRIGEPDDRQLTRGLVAGKHVDAIICANDRIAAILMRGLEKAGARVPQDVRVVGFGDVRYATLPHPPSQR